MTRGKSSIDHLPRRSNQRSSEVVNG
uniref:Uncharacterized protein n=1 Tax=Anguilla anguilla TaxID=7936 RepID=A0A0E9UQM3_ANGAN